MHLTPDTPLPCPICGKPGRLQTRPFCSPHCAQVDLGRWFGEGYVVPGRDGDARHPEGDDEA